MTDKPEKTDAEWKKELSREEFHVCRGKGTEAPFTGEYWDCHDDGTYHCRCCGVALFASDTKYDSGSGWPSFYAALDKSAVAEHTDVSHGMTRTEITCAKCGSHLGHVFPDGPKPTGLRYCVNSLSLTLEPRK